MARPYEVSLVSNTRDFVRGLGDAATATEGIGDSLDDLVAASRRAGDDLGDNIRDGASTGESAVSDLERQFRDLATAGSSAGRDAGDGIGDNVRRGTDAANEGVQSIRDEAAATSTEVAASFDGSIESIGSGFQELAANAFAGFGPAGMIAGIAAAAGLGLIFAKIEEGKASAQEFKDEIGELTTKLIESGRDGAPALQDMVDALKELAAASEDGADNLTDLKETSKLTGLSFEGLAQSYAGNSEALDAMIDKQKEEMGVALRADAANTKSATSYGKATSDKTTALGELGDNLADIKTKADAAAEAERLYAASGGPEIEAKAALIETVNDAYDEGASNVDDYIDAESGLFDTGAYIAAMLEKEEALKSYQETLATSPLTPAAKSFLDSQGAESAAVFLAGYKSATPAQQAELARIWDQAGQKSSGSYSDALKAGIPTSIAGPEILIKQPNPKSIFDYLQTSITGYGPLKLTTSVSANGKSILGG